MAFRGQGFIPLLPPPKCAPGGSSRQRSSGWNLGDLRCCICSESDSLTNLHRAAEINKKRSRDFDPKKHIAQRTNEWKELASTP